MYYLSRVVKFSGVKIFIEDNQSNNGTGFAVVIIKVQLYSNFVLQNVASAFTLAYLSLSYSLYYFVDFVVKVYGGHLPFLDMDLPGLPISVSFVHYIILSIHVSFS